MKILLIDNYDSFTFNLYHYLSSFKINVDVIRNDKITDNEIIRKRYNRIVISPGPCTPNEAGISVQLVQHSKVPLLGVCLGHQSIGAAFGAKIIKAPQIFHGKTSEVQHSGEGLFKDIPSSFLVVRYHSLIIDNLTLPEELSVTCTILDSPDIIMGIEHKTKPIFGVQFHPESIDTDHGMQLINNFLAL